MKTGLVLEGGAYRTIYSSGVCDGLLEAGVDFDYVVGVSAGIAYGVSFISRQFGRNLEILIRFGGDPRYIGLRNVLKRGNGHCWFGLDFIYDDIPNGLVPYDYDALAAWPGLAEAVVTDMDTGRAAYFPITQEDRRFTLLRATCAMPLLFPIFDHEGIRCLDGGCADAIPWRRALEQGCDRVVVVLTRERSYRRKPGSTEALVELVYRKYPNFVNTMRRRPENYNRCREEIFQAEREGKLLVFAPDSTEGFSRTEQDKEKIYALWRQGVEHARMRGREVLDYLAG